MKIVHEQTLDLYRGAGGCEWCRKIVRRREPHHIFCRGMAGGGRIDARPNLISLCATFSGGDDCHAAVTAGVLTRYDMLAVVAVREGVLQHELERIVYAIRRHDKDRQPPPGLAKWLPEGWLIEKGWLKGDAA